jgi:HD-GYP domain-containing protein (c-di-GMP phosphodiesterase class II)
MLRWACSGVSRPIRADLTKNNIRRLLLTFEALSDLGRQIAAEQDFSETARFMLSSLASSVGAKEAMLFSYSERPALLTSLAAIGFLQAPQVAVMPLLPKHAHALANARGPQILGPGDHEHYLSANGNVAPELFRCIAPLRVRSKLVGVAALGRREDDALYTPEDLEALELLSNYIAVAVQNHTLAQTLEERIAESLRLMSSLHNFYDNTLAAFAAAADIKHANVHGHSLRVGRYAAGIGQAMGLESIEVSGLKAAGYLHDVGMIVVDKQIFGKPAALDDEELRAMQDHTLVGHRIVSSIEFPWPRIPEVVRGHHERADGSGYPDHLRLEELSSATRIVAVAETFDAMISERPYRPAMGVGEALNELVRLTPTKYDPAAVHGLLVQIRRDASGSNKVPFLDEHVVCSIAPPDIDQIAALLQHKLTNGRTYRA